MAGPVRIAILANGRQARAEFATTSASAERMGALASKAGKVIAGAFAIGALVRAGEAVGKVGASYVSSLNKIQALTGSTSAQMTDAAQQIERSASSYAKYGQTAGDAAEGIVELAKSGLSLKDSLSAVHGTMLLAKAGELSVADASTFVSNTLNTFSLKASQAGKIANTLANAANISSADVTDLAESFKYAAPLAAKAGLSVDQTSAILAELSNQGVKASQAGTSLRSMLIRLQAPSTAANVTLGEMGVSIFDASGKVKPFTTILGDLSKGIGKLKGQDRAYALKNIFGVNAMTAAQILLKGNVKQLNEYTKGVKRAGAADALAASASRGLAGSLASIKAYATSSVQSLYRQYSPKLNAVIVKATGFVSANKDAIIGTAKAIGDHLGPALKSLAQLAADTAKAFNGSGGGLAKSLGSDLLKSLEKLLDVVGKAADLLDKIPGPIKAIGVEAGIASLVLPRLTAGVTSVTSSMSLGIARMQQYRAEMSYGVTRTQNLQSAMTKLSSAARTAAGIGGMVGLTESAKSSNAAINILGGTASGALLGFSVGGPVGAAVGGLAGGLYGLATAASNTGPAFAKSTPPIGNYAASLRGVAGAATAATRATAANTLQQSGLLTMLPKIGLSGRDVVSAILGQKGAYEKVTAAARKYELGTTAQSDAAVTLERFLGDNASAFDKQRRAAILAAAATQDWGKALKGIPASKRTKIEALGAGASRAEVEKLGKQLKLTPRQVRIAFKALNPLSVARDTDKVHRGLDDVGRAAEKLPQRVQLKVAALGGEGTKRDLLNIARQAKATPKQVRLIFAAAGVPQTRKQIQGIADAMRATGKVRPSLAGYLSSLSSQITTARKRAENGAQALVKGLTNPVKQAKGNLSLYSGSIVTGTAHARGLASSGGVSVGAALKQGTLNGVAGLESALAGQMAGAVRAAVAAAKQAGNIHSPSRETLYVGEMLGRGLEVGMQRRKPGAKKAGHDLVRELLKGITNGSDGIGKVLDRIANLVQKRIKGKDQEKRQSAVLRLLRAQEKQLKANGRAQDKNNKLLDTAKQKYRDLVQAANQYAAQIKQSFVDYGNVVGLGAADGSSSVSITRLLSQLQARAVDAQKFAALIARLRAMGLNRTNIQQLLDAGVDAGLGTAEAIASGGAAAIAQINALTAQIGSTGSALGQKMRDAYYSAGLKAAQALVNGLAKKQRQLDRAATHMADALIARLQQRLGAAVKAPDQNPKPPKSTTTTTHARVSALDTYVSARAAAPQRMEIKLTAQQLDQLARGRALQADLDAWHRAGGRKAS